MRKLVLGASIALTSALGVSLSSALKVEARPVNSDLPFQIAQFSDPGLNTPEVLTPSTSEALTPTLEPITEVADYYAFVDSFDGQTLYVRLADGTTQKFTFPEGIGGADYNLNPGDLVALNADKRNVISGLDNPVVEQEFVGEVTSYTNGNLIATSVTGETVETPVSEAVASRLNLQNGDEVKVTYFQNIPGMASICKVKRGPVVQAPPPIIEQPVQPPIIPPAPVVEGLW